MKSLEKVLIIGGGTAGMSAAISLRAQGIAVDLLEIDPEWRPLGAGISTNAAMLRALDSLGLLSEFLRMGHAGDGTVIRKPNGEVTARVPANGVAREGVPGIGGILRADLARMMAEKTKASGTRVILGHKATAIREASDHVEVETSDGHTERYDLVVVSDGLYSKTRDQLFPGLARPRYVGQAVWRAVMDRPEGIDTLNVWVGHKGIKPGLNPISHDKVYLFIAVDMPEKIYLDQSVYVSEMKRLLEPFECPMMRKFRQDIGEDSSIDYRPIEDFLVTEPWYRGRVLMIGDTVHGTSPQLTAGAMMAIEDGIVLADEVKAGGAVEEMLSRFVARRFDRCRLVVENSARQSAIEIEGGREAEYQQVMRDSAIALAKEI